MVQPKIIEDHWLLKHLPSNATGITLWPFGIYVREEHLEDRELVRHENIHWVQQMQLPIIWFLLYGVEYLFKGIINSINSNKKHIRSLSCELEANAWQNDTEYLSNRPFLAQLKYIFRMKTIFYS